MIKIIAIEIRQYPKKCNIKSTSLIVQPVIIMLSLLHLKTFFFFFHETENDVRKNERYTAKLQRLKNDLLGKLSFGAIHL